MKQFCLLFLAPVPIIFGLSYSKENFGLHGLRRREISDGSYCLCQPFPFVDCVTHWHHQAKKKEPNWKKFFVDKQGQSRQHCPQARIAKTKLEIEEVEGKIEEGPRSSWKLRKSEGEISHVVKGWEEATEEKIKSILEGKKECLGRRVKSLHAQLCCEEDKNWLDKITWVDEATKEWVCFRVFLKQARKTVIYLVWARFERDGRELQVFSKDGWQYQSFCALWKKSNIGVGNHSTRGCTR